MERRNITASKPPISSLVFTLLVVLLMGIVLPVTVSVAASTKFDASVVDRKQILYWLIKRAEISAEASNAQQQAAVDAYIGLSATDNDSSHESTKSKRAVFVKRSPIAAKRVQHQSRSRLASYVANDVIGADVIKTVKVLTILVDFPDLKFDENRLIPADTPMYYASYPTSHYQGLVFSTSGYTGPQGGNQLSVYQYYQAVSGERFFLTGDVKGWVRANNNAAFYGANDNSNNDRAAEALVTEAVIKVVASMSAVELASYDIEDPLDFDNDGNLDEADGDIDHVMLFHSSIGEESGGGVLGNNAIWSHRYFVYNNNIISGTGKRVFSYTVQPIDAAVGVVVHEYGHVLGLPDEYDLSALGYGSPVGSWSVMSNGSWGGSIRGTEPTGLSPYARAYLQQQYQGRWVNELEVSLSELDSSVDIELVEAVNHTQINQLSIMLPVAALSFLQPYSGEFQYYSGQGNQLNNDMSFTLSLPHAAAVTLSLQAHWNIEQDYDYVQVLIDGLVIAGNYTKASNKLNGASHIISGSSANIVGAQGPNSWLDLEYDLSAYAGSEIEISIRYRTDANGGDYGIAIDELRLVVDGSVLYTDGAEVANSISLDGFSRITDQRLGGPSRYLVQLRSYNGIDTGLRSDSYQPGVLIWLENLNYTDNDSSIHPGKGLIGVIDVDQNLIGSGGGDYFGTEKQIRDATLSMFNQDSYFGDEHLSSISLFDDRLDYSAPLQPRSGIVLPGVGLTLEVVAQSADSSSATVRLNRRTALPLSVSFTYSATNLDVNFDDTSSGGFGPLSYSWDFGDGLMSNAQLPSHSYATGGTYSVTLTVSDALGEPDSQTQTVVVTALVVELDNVESGGSGGGSLAWFTLIILAMFGLARRRHSYWYIDSLVG